MINEIVKSYPININGMDAFEKFNIIPLGYYDVLIRMDWLENNYVILDCGNKIFTFFEEG